ncbi:hypothetical protein ACFYXS_02805 [Streptomyces sp. NPDC002574]|uniref:hypothetical protein n=1 Tax=Streptomyces sp. NPDC002574 TaxID=3364652 RepID=UPI003684B32F
MARNPFTEDEQDRLRQLHADGLSRNAIAEAMSRPQVTISRWAERLGLSFDRSATRAATEARQVDLTEQRQRARQVLMDHFFRQMDRTSSRYLLTAASNSGEIHAQFVDEPPARETKDLTAAAVQALMAAEKLTGDSGREEAQGLLRTLGEAMTTAARELGGDDADEYGS